MKTRTLRWLLLLVVCVATGCSALMGPCNCQSRLANGEQFARLDQ